jgi:membrane protease YdiL (CAAX protease family)
MSLFRRSPVAAFFILAYGLSWLFMGLGLWLLNGNAILTWSGAIMPALSAILVLAITEGREGLTQLLKRLIMWRVGIQWYLVALLGPLAIVVTALPFHAWLGGRTLPPLSPGFWSQTLPSAIISLLLVATFGIFMSAGEEIGWRGFAQPRLQARFGPWWASLILGFLWGCWHLPLFFIPGSVQYGLPIPGFVLASVVYSLIYTCLYNRTQGSVLLASLFHSASNTTLSYAAVIFPFILKDLYISLPGLAVVTLVVMVISGSLTSAAPGSQNLA